MGQALPCSGENGNRGGERRFARASRPPMKKARREAGLSLNREDADQYLVV
jgi:hypothetical protein